MNQTKKKQKSFFFLHQWRKKNLHKHNHNNNKPQNDYWLKTYLSGFIDKILIRFTEILGRKVVAKFKNLIKILKILN